MAKQTAVEWLVENLDIIWEEKIIDLVEQAKEMERTQIVKAYDKGEFNSGVNETSEQYYVKIYK
jgi:hypothetical protein